MSYQNHLEKKADAAFASYQQELQTAAEAVGVPIHAESIQIAVGAGVRVAAAVAVHPEYATAARLENPIALGLVHLSGRLGGDSPPAGTYLVQMVIADGQRYALLRDRQGYEVSRVPLEITRHDETNLAITGFCDSPIDVGQDHVCVGFRCCNVLTGCFTHSLCFHIEQAER
jgi:hypothetical protein